MRNEALVSRVLKMVANTRSQWNITCDGNMDPTEFANRDWVNKSKAKVKVRRKQAPRTVPRALEKWKFEKRWTSWWSANRSMGKLTRLMRSTSILCQRIKVVRCTIKKDEIA